MLDRNLTDAEHKNQTDAVHRIGLASVVLLSVVLALQAFTIYQGRTSHRYRELLTQYVALCDRLVTEGPKISRMRGVTLEVDGRLICVEGDQRGEMAESVKLPRRP